MFSVTVDDFLQPDEILYCNASYLDDSANKQLINNIY